MLRHHCDGCDKVIDLDVGYCTVSVSFKKKSDVEHGSNENPEKERDLCGSCMSGIRVALDVVDYQAR